MNDEGMIKNYKVNIGFWLLGICNNYPYVVMLSAAHDILNDIESKNNTDLNCTKVGTGAILLADIIPTFIFKLFAPSFILAINFPYKVLFVVAAAVMSFIMVGLANTYVQAIIGVVFASLSSGVGEVTFLSLTSYYSESSISFWSSGTGGAGVLGAVSYVLLTIWLSSRNTLFIISVIPLIILLVYFILLPKSNHKSLSWRCFRSYEVLVENDQDEPEDKTQKPTSWKDKFKASKNFLYLTIPLGLVYVAEYIINQTYFELMFFKNSKWTHKVQYRIYQAIYQIGVFISRSSLYCFKIEKTWIFTILQILNLVIFQLQVLYKYIPTIYVIFLLILYEGLLGGASYVNTFYMVSVKSSFNLKEFNMAASSFWDSFGILLAGFISVPLHNVLCETITF